jgi:hypothetical protein
MFWINLHLDVVAWSAAAFWIGYATRWARTRKNTQRKR